MNRLPRAVAVLLVVAAPAAAPAQDFVWSGTGLPGVGVLLQSYSFGTKASPSGGSVVEQPFVFSRIFDPNSFALLQLLARQDALPTSAVRRERSESTSVPPPGFNLAGATLHGYLATLQFTGSSNEPLMEQLTVRYADLAISDSSVDAEPPPPALHGFSGVIISGAGIDALSAATRSTFTAFSFGLERVTSSSGSVGATFRPLPITFSRRPLRSAGADNAFFLGAVRQAREFPLVNVELVPAGNFPAGARYLLKFSNLVFTSARTVVSGNSVGEQVTATFKRVEISTPQGKVAFTVGL